jgi:hypothetical protein
MDNIILDTVGETKRIKFPKELRIV